MVTKGKVCDMCVSNLAKLAGQHNVANQTEDKRLFLQG